MKRITVHAFDKDSSTSQTATFEVNVSKKKDLEVATSEFFDSLPFRKFYWETESEDTFTEAEDLMLSELGLEVS